MYGFQEYNMETTAPLSTIKGLFDFDIDGVAWLLPTKMDQPFFKPLDEPGLGDLSQELIMRNVPEPIGELIVTAFERLLSETTHIYKYTTISNERTTYLYTTEVFKLKKEVVLMRKDTEEIYYRFNDTDPYNHIKKLSFNNEDNVLIVEFVWRYSPDKFN